MKNINLNKIESILADHADALVTIKALMANIENEKSVLSKALFSCASFEARANDNARRLRMFNERAVHFTWQAIIEELSAQNGELSLYSHYAYTSGTYYSFDIKAAVMSPFQLPDAYKGRMDYYAGRKTPLAVPTMENVEKLYSFMAASAVNDAHHVWSFLNKCGADYKADQTTFKKRMTWRATADGYDWKFGLANLYRIFCQHTGRAWSWDSLNAEIRNSGEILRNGGTFDAFADMVTLTKNGNGNSTLIFTPEAVTVLNSFNGGIGYKAAYDHFINIANEIV